MVKATKFQWKISERKISVELESSVTFIDLTSFVDSLQANLLILKDRLYNSLGAQGMQCPFQKINVLPAGAKQPQQPQQRSTQAQRQAGQIGTRQAQAKGSFGTVTTPSSSYSNPGTYTTPYSQMNGTNSQPSYYNPAANVTATPPMSSAGVVGKGTVILHGELHVSF